MVGRVKLTKLISTNFAHQTKEFFGNSTLHGVRYIAENGRKFSEKFMWFCCVAIGAVAALVIIDSLWEKFQTNPTITGNGRLNCGFMGLLLHLIAQDSTPSSSIMSWNFPLSAFAR
jgi:hypothetical protein